MNRPLDIITPEEAATLKLRRKQLQESYADEIEDVCGTLTCASPPC